MAPQCARSCRDSGTAHRLDGETRARPRAQTRPGISRRKCGGGCDEISWTFTCRRADPSFRDRALTLPDLLPQPFRHGVRRTVGVVAAGAEVGLAHGGDIDPA